MSDPHNAIFTCTLKDGTKEIFTDHFINPTLAWKSFHALAESHDSKWMDTDKEIVSFVFTYEFPKS